MNCIVRDFDVADAEALYQIELSCFTSPWSLAQFECIHKFDYAHFFVCEFDGVTVGFSGIYCLGDAELVNIAVLPEYRGKGIGKLLLSHSLQKAKELGCENMLLEVRRSNDNAIKLYESFGFIKISERKRYYADPVEDALVMIKEQI